MRPLFLLSFLVLTACGGSGLTRGDGTSACASLAAKQRAAANVDKDYEDIRQRTVASPTEKNQQKLSEIATQAAAANDVLKAAEAEHAAGRCPKD